MKRFVATLKQFVMRWATPGLRWLSAGLGRTRINYAGMVGDGRGNSIVVACLGWVQRTFPEAPLMVVETDAEGNEQAVAAHPLTALIRRPNPYYSGRLLWQPTLSDLEATGNAYWLKIRGRYREPVELWWVPEFMMAPAWPKDGSQFISHYEYKVNGQTIRIESPDVVHFRWGLDPDNPRKGLSSLACLMREIFTDDEAANWSASLLRNGGVPGVIISPDDDDTELTPEDAEGIKQEYRDRFSGDAVGAPMILSARAKVSPVAFNPQQMDLGMLRRIPEARISAVLGIPAAVVGLNAGLEQTKVGATMAEMREMAYESHIIPLQALMAETLDVQLLPDFATNDRQFCKFDLSNVRVLQEDQDRLYQRLSMGVRAGWIKIAQAKAEVGLPVEPGDDVYLWPTNAVAVGPEAAEFAEPEPEPVTTTLQLTADEDPPAKGLRFKSKADGLENLDLSNASDADRRLIARFESDLLAKEGPFAARLEKAFAEIASEVLAAGRKGRKDAETEEWPETWRFIADNDGAMVDTVIPVAAAATIQAVYEWAYKAILQSTFGIVSERLEMPIGINLEDPIARALLAQAGQRIVNIDEQTREAIRQALVDGRIAGDGAEPLARRIRGYIEGRDMYPGIYQRAYDRALERGLSAAEAEAAGDLASRHYRALTIARTETKWAQNQASIIAYRASDVVEGLLVYDGIDWDAPCREANGQTWTFEEGAANPLEHPRCVRNFAPVVR